MSNNENHRPSSALNSMQRPAEVILLKDRPLPTSFGNPAHQPLAAGVVAKMMDGAVLSRAAIDMPPRSISAKKAALRHQDFEGTLERTRLKAAAAPHKPLFRSKAQRPQNWTESQA